MEIKRDALVSRLLEHRHNGMIKVITGMRRSGKSYLLFNLFTEALRSEGIDDTHIIKVNLEDRRNKELRNPDILLQFIDNQLKDKKMHYILLDEVQLVREFEDVLNSYLHISNADVYVTGSNAKFLSKDIITEFRGRGDEIHIGPLSFRELLLAKPDFPKEDLLRDYMTYGGLPQIVTMSSNSEREAYLKGLFVNTYLRDIKERHAIKLDEDLSELIDFLASGIGGFTNSRKLMNTFLSVKKRSITQDTIITWLDWLQDAFFIEKAVRYDIKGRKYIGTPSKYYFGDTGLRNARLNFRQTEWTHLMENVIYNELRGRGFSVNVGQVGINTLDVNGKKLRKNLEVDFVCNQGYKRYYIQSAYSIPDKEKMNQETESLRKIGDSFKKIVVVNDRTFTYQNDDGILIMNILDFLSDENSLAKE
jgi:predicted AAA+ superfamily ATPase